MANFWRSARGLAAGDRSDEFALHRWVPWDPAAVDDPMAGMLNRFLATGTAAAPVGAPGERFHYSDTAYVLLGVLVELATGRRYAELQRERICDPLGLDDTTLAYHEDGDDDACDGPGVMDVWLGDIALLSAGLDLSLDWGGGGQVSTVADLCRFLRGLLAGELFDDPTTIDDVDDLGAPGAPAPAAPRGGTRSVPLAGRIARSWSAMPAPGACGCSTTRCRACSSPGPSGNETTARG